MGFHVIEGPARFTEFSTIYDDTTAGKTSPYQYGEVRAERKASVSSTAGTPVTTYNPVTRTWIFVKAQGAISANTVLERDMAAATVAEQYAAGTATGIVHNALVVGVADHAITAGWGGWVIYSGLCRVVTAAGVSKGDVCTATAASGRVDTIGAATSATGIGVAMEATGGAGSIILFHLRP